MIVLMTAMLSWFVFAFVSDSGFSLWEWTVLLG